MIAIIDYGVGNLFSLQSSFAKVGAETVLAKDERTIENAEKILLPGVGAFADAAKKLKESGLDEVLKRQVQKGKYVMGVCLGMQLLFEEDHEYGCHKGLGLLQGEVVPMRGYIDEGLKIPHVGWNALHIEKPNFLLKYCKEGDYVYYVHSYFADKCKESVIATSEYSKPITAAVAKDNVLGCQFHPEKSGEVGLNVLRAFCEAKG